MKYQAKKKFGQNFLHDQIILEKIVKAIPNSSNSQIVEIGAGLGDLTQHLLKSQDVVGFEIDPDLCKYLEKKFSVELKNGKLKLHCGDVLDFWNQNSLIKNKYQIIANLPYYVATKIILKSLEDKNCNSLIVLIQKEVADKFLAEAGDRNFSSLSVIAKTLSSVEKIIDVNPSSFEPPPKVQSTVIKLEKFEFNESYNILENFIQFKKFLETAFKQPRKKLLGNLSKDFPKNELENIFLNLGLDFSIRPHQVAIVDYHQIFEQLNSLK